VVETGEVSVAADAVVELLQKDSGLLSAGLAYAVWAVEKKVVASV